MIVTINLETSCRFYWTQKTFKKIPNHSKLSNCSRHCCILFIFHSYLNLVSFLTIRDVLFYVSHRIHLQCCYDKRLLLHWMCLNFMTIFYDIPKSKSIIFISFMTQKKRRDTATLFCLRSQAVNEKNEDRLQLLQLKFDEKFVAAFERFFFCQIDKHKEKKSLHKIAKIATNCRRNFVISVSRSRSMSTVQTDNDAAV